MAGINSQFLKYRNFAPNLFSLISISDPNDASNTISTIDGIELKYIATSINIPGFGITSERNKATKLFLPTAYQFPDQFSISWDENYRLAVRNIHESWLNKFYQTATDSWKNGKTGKKLDFQIKIYSSDNISGDLTEVKTVTLKGCIPQNLFDLSLDYKSDSSDSIFTINYSIDRVD